MSIYSDKVKEIELRYEHVLKEVFEFIDTLPNQSDDHLKEVTRAKLEEMKNKELEELENS